MVQDVDFVAQSERYWPVNKRPIAETTQEMILVAILTELRAIRAQLTAVTPSSPPTSFSHPLAAPPERRPPKGAPPQRKPD